MRTVSRRGVLKVSAGASGRQPMLAQLRDDDLADLIGQAGQPAGRQLLAADFEQQLAIHLALALDAATGAGGSSTYALAMPTASCRTRRM